MRRRPPAPLADPDAFSRAYRLHAPAALAAAEAILRDRAAAEEIVQDVFAGLWERPDRWDPRRGPLASYVRLVARSRALDQWRHLSVRLAVAQRLAGERLEHAAPEQQPEERALRRERAERLGSVLRTVPHEQREALLLCHVGGLTTEEIAARTQVPLGTAKSRVRLGARRTAQALLAA
jgi:RNA polymerase sigma-70 factor (ECF subfamily)